MSTFVHKGAGMKVVTASDVGRLIKETRTRRSITQADLAMAAGVSRRWLVDLEAGKPRAELELTLRVLASLGVELHAERGTPHSSPGPLGTNSDVDLDEHLTALMRRR